MIPPSAKSRLQLRHPVGIDTDGIETAVRKKLDAAGLQRVQIGPVTDASFPASRSDLEDPSVKFVTASMERALDEPPCILPNLGVSLPNAIFTDILQLPTIWIRHSYPSCRQHGADKHLSNSTPKWAWRSWPGFSGVLVKPEGHSQVTEATSGKWPIQPCGIRLLKADRT
ncbi:hypothetical protein [Martelella soudanensis]|uniref:hypothetical protein n=1 Tax=unclassified Martelella TaxID=2629616 RepID=UPI0015DE8B62|nr:MULTISPECIES: hypothetical protein [unclassified Martelella]